MEHFCLEKSSKENTSHAEADLHKNMTERQKTKDGKVIPMSKSA